MDEKGLINTLLQIPAESQTLEFKRLAGVKVVEKIVQTIVGMTNAEGGVLVIGIDDPEKSQKTGLDRIYGIEENFEFFDSIGEEIKRMVPPLISIWPPHKIHVPEISKTVAIIYIPKSTENFRSIDNKVWVRQEKSNKSLSPQEIIKFSYIKGFQKADKELVDVDFDLLGTEEYRTWKNAREIPGEEIKEILMKVGLARKNELGKIFPTRAAVLLFAEYPNDILDTKCTIRVFQYTGTLEKINEVPNLISTPKTIGGPIIKQLKDAHNYVLSLLRAGIRVPSGFTNQYIIPERAIKEAITNAVIHRDYFFKRDIEVKIFEDRVEIVSPGLLPYNITAYNIGFTRADGYRNDLLVKHLREFPEPPNLDQNEGVRAMRIGMKSQGLYPPVFLTYPYINDSVIVVLRNEKIASEWEKISHFLERNKYITNEKAREITGVVQRDKMSKMLKNWVSKGLLIRILPASGFVKGVKYRLPATKEIEEYSDISA